MGNELYVRLQSRDTRLLAALDSKIFFGKQVMLLEGIATCDGYRFAFDNEKISNAIRHVKWAFRQPPSIQA